MRAGGPPLLIGGVNDAAFRRVSEVGAGWIAGGAERARQAWADAGRSGSPRLAALAALLRFGEQATDERVQALAGALDQLPGAVGVMRDYRNGRGLGINEGS